MSKIPSRQTLAGIGENQLYVPMDGNGNASISGNLKISANVSVAGEASASTLTIENNALVKQNLVVEGTAISETLQVNGSGTIAQNLLVSGSETILQDLAVEGNQLIAKNLTINKSLLVDENLSVVGSATVQSSSVLGSQMIGAELSVGNGIVAGSLTTAAGNIICGAPGIFVGNGSGLTNLPQATLGPPAFYFQSQLINFSVVVPNRFDPAINVPTPAVTIPCEMFGKPTGLYFWKTDSNIALPQLFNSASGMLYWDGTKISGQTTYSLTQLVSAFNPLYSLTMTYLSFTSLTVMDVVIESTNSSINPAQFDAYFVNFYKIF